MCFLVADSSLALISSRLGHGRMEEDMTRREESKESEQDAIPWA
jgi:hypothetical protein